MKDPIIIVSPGICGSSELARILVEDFHIYMGDPARFAHTTETRDGTTLPAYRGDLINSTGFTESQRTPDPELLLRGYERAALTLNFIRGLIDGGFAGRSGS